MGLLATKLLSALDFSPFVEMVEQEQEEGQKMFADAAAKARASGHRDVFCLATASGPCFLS